MNRLVVPALLAALALTGCSPATTEAKEPSLATKPVVTPVPSPTPTPTSTKAPVSSRGNLIKVVGQPFGLGDETTGQLASFVVTAITVDPQCSNEYAVAPEVGHFVKLDITGETMPALAPNKFFLAGGSWKAITDAGTTVNSDPWNGASNSCLTQAERIPNVVGPGEKVAGSLVLDVPTPHGTIVLSQGGNASWEWTY